jgi:hypothetical protein
MPRVRGGRGGGGRGGRGVTRNLNEFYPGIGVPPTGSPIYTWPSPVAGGSATPSLQ